MVLINTRNILMMHRLLFTKKVMHISVLNKTGIKLKMQIMKLLYIIFLRNVKYAINRTHKHLFTIFIIYQTKKKRYFQKLFKNH